jgi:hypothetical protein
MPAEKSFKFEYTVAGARNTPMFKMIRGANLSVAQRMFIEQTKDKTEPEIVDVWQHVATGSVKTIRKNTVIKL